MAYSVKEALEMAKVERASIAKCLEAANNELLRVASNMIIKSPSESKKLSRALEKEVRWQNELDQVEDKIKALEGLCLSRRASAALIVPDTSSDDKLAAIEALKARETEIKDLVLSEVAKKIDRRGDATWHAIAQNKPVFGWDDGLGEPYCRLTVVLSGKPGIHNFHVNKDLEIVSYDHIRPKP